MKAIYISGMACKRCVSLISNLIGKTGAELISIELGQVRLAKLPNPQTIENIKQSLEAHGYNLIDPSKSLSIPLIKNTITSIINDTQLDTFSIDWSSALSEKLGHDYHVITAFFNYIEGITMDQFIARQKIERVKELLTKETNLAEISKKLGYHNVQQLCNQFKKMTGFSPSSFKIGSANDFQFKKLTYSS